MNSTRLTGERIIRLPELVQRIGKKRSTIYADIKAGLMPRPISLGARSVGWLETEIDEWISLRIAASRGGEK